MKTTAMQRLRLRVSERGESGHEERKTVKTKMKKKKAWEQRPISLCLSVLFAWS